jgi:hypothetical protein
MDIHPQTDSIVKITGLRFFEKAPSSYAWIDGGTGPNNFPEMFGIRILKDGTEIFREENIQTSPEWTEKIFDFIDLEAFTIDEATIMRFELLPYCPVGNGAVVSAWDIDEISVFGGCLPSQPSESIILGNVFTKYGYPIPDAEMQLSQEPAFADVKYSNTDLSGAYAFEHVERKKNYYLKSYKNNDILNGVSTLDLLLIQKHLLGLIPFSTLDQYIAADINHDGVVNALDLVSLRKAVLGIHTFFPGNTSWRFGPVPQAMHTSDISLFREIYSIESLLKDTLVVDFMGIKIGDLNGSVMLPFSNQGFEQRDDEIFLLNTYDKETTPGELITIPVLVREVVNTAGFQIAIDLKDLEFISIESITMPLAEDSYSVLEGILKISCSPGQFVSLGKNDILFTLTCRTSQYGKLSEQLRFDLKSLQPELYTQDLFVRKLHLNFSENGSNPAMTNYFKAAPNPVHTEVNLHFKLEKGGMTVIRFIDVQGKVIHEIQKYYMPGDHQEKVNVSTFSRPGSMAYCQLIASDYTAIERIIVLN